MFNVIIKLLGANGYENATSILARVWDVKNRVCCEVLLTPHTHVEHRREAIGGDDLSRPSLVEAMVRGGAEAWKAVTSFCEAIMLAKKVASRDRDQRRIAVSQPRLRPSPSSSGRPRGCPRGRTRGRPRRPVMISSHRRRWLADG